MVRALVHVESLVSEVVSTRSYPAYIVRTIDPEALPIELSTNVVFVRTFGPPIHLPSLSRSSPWLTAGPGARVARESGQGLTAAAISGRHPVPPVSWPSTSAMGGGCGWGEWGVMGERVAACPPRCSRLCPRSDLPKAPVRVSPAGACGLCAHRERQSWPGLRLAACAAGGGGRRR